MKLYKKVNLKKIIIHVDQKTKIQSKHNYFKIPLIRSVRKVMEMILKKLKGVQNLLLM